MIGSQIFITLEKLHAKKRDFISFSRMFTDSVCKSSLHLSQNRKNKAPYKQKE